MCVQASPSFPGKVIYPQTKAYDSTLGCKPLVNLGCSIDSIDRWRQPGCYGSGYSGVLTPMQYLGVLTPMQ